MIEAPVQGYVAAGFEPVQDAFAANFERHAEVGAACCIHLHGRPVVDIWGGVAKPGGDQPYTGETMQMVMSSTKGIVAVAAHMLAQEGRLDFDTRVIDYWPEFAAAGKADIPVRWLFSHRSGLAAIEQPLTFKDVLDWHPVTEALATQRPLWEPNTTHGYHVGTYGWLAGEVIRRISGLTPGQFVAEQIAGPLKLDLHIGLPRELNIRVADIVPAPLPPAGSPPDPFMAKLLDPNTLMHKAFANPLLAPSVYNEPDFRAAEVPAANGITTARSLSRLYAACIGEVDGVTLLEPETLRKAIQTQSQGEDLVLGYQTHYGTGFQLPFPFRPMAGPGSFGHYGMGGSVGFAHPELDFSFGYVMNQMLPSGRVDPRTEALIKALLACLR